MKKSILIIATLLAALVGSAQAQAPAATTNPDPTVQMRLEKKEIDKVYSNKKNVISSERKAKVKAAGDAAAAAPKGKETGVARRDAEAQAKAATKADYDAKMKVLKKEHDDALAVLKKKYPPADKP
jgi:hypothetical protein